MERVAALSYTPPIAHYDSIVIAVMPLTLVAQALEELELGQRPLADKER